MTEDLTQHNPVSPPCHSTRPDLTNYQQANQQYHPIEPIHLISITTSQLPKKTQGMGFHTKRSRNLYDYVFCVIIGLITGFLISNTYLSTQWKVRFVPCLSAFTVANSHHHRLQTPHILHNGATTKLLLICVLTTRRHIESRALALHRVLTPDLYSDVIFFIGGEEPYNGELPVVILKGIPDDEYPPRRKSFAMLRYVNQFYGNHFNWFMRVDDDIYINLKKLESLLFRMNAEDKVYLGHPGLGTQKEFGHIGLEGDTPYCMGGPGVLLSRKLLNGITGQLATCLNSTASVHEDSELGRCIFKYFGLSCTRSEEVGLNVLWKFD
ncbi:hypothetical protein LOTGIDRAFT_163867 [Lottia gigantea]|uniref:Fringe-like glycosyltransferase domain-containing protein n=1 Tax=Lottia gigantea TaxID=225164 RepID=V4A6J4_LOTGI|nr:hypothetical protein LOTGIDRAFT_163867 [Lottia gigantea]ESO90645.1 hypothetical protein LOTGIDRAFT_163867 [Lottia gigantea]